MVPPGRLDSLDIVRAVALLGIAAQNLHVVVHPAQPWWAFPGAPQPGVLEGAAFWLLELVSGGHEFYIAPFAFLFGITLAMLQAHRDWPVARLARRLVVLGLFGLANGVALWLGDVLLALALMGGVLLLLGSRLPLAWHWPLALVLLAITPVLYWFHAAPLGLWGAPVWSGWAQARAAAFGEVTGFVRSTDAVSVAEAFANRWHHLIAIYRAGVYWLPMLLGFMLLGRWAWCSGWFTALAASSERRRGLLRLVLPLSLILMGASTLLLHGESIRFATPPVALGLTLQVGAQIGVTFALLAVTVAAHARLAWLAPLGRMALTFYIAQAVVFHFLSQPGVLEGALTPLDRPTLWLAFLVWLGTAQVVLARWWLARFRQGPLE